MMSLNLEQRANALLDVHLPLTRSSYFHRPSGIFERRAKPRSSAALPARVWGVDSDDQAFSFDCEVENLSSSGAYLTIPRRMEFSSGISLVVHLLHSPDGQLTAGIKGRVVRVEPQPDGRHGVAVKTTDYQFL